MMSIQDFWRILTRRWWVIALLTVLLSGGALLYAHRQQRIYQATATVFAHPSGVTSPGDYSSDVGLLTYGTLADTFAALAQSRTLLSQAAHSVGVNRDLSRTYSVSANTIAQTTVLEISVDGPDPALAARLANSLAAQAAAATARYYHIFALSPLDRATVPRAPIRPQTSHDVLYGGLAGLIFGFIVAALSIYLPELLDPSPRVAPRGATQLQWHVPSASPLGITPRRDSGLARALPAQSWSGNVQSTVGPVVGAPAMQSPLLKRATVPADSGAHEHPSLNGAHPPEGEVPEAPRRDS